MAFTFEKTKLPGVVIIMPLTKAGIFLGTTFAVNFIGSMD